MTQEGVLGDPALEGRGEGGDVVDAFSGVRALAEKILIDVGGRGGVGVEPGGTGEDPLEEGCAALGGNGGGDPRLEDRVAVDDAARSPVEGRPVQRMGHGADQAGRGAAGQTGVGVEGDHVADPRGHVGGPPVDRGERRVARAREQVVQLVELPALALPSHPLALARVPEPPAVEQEKARPRRGRGPVAGVEPRDAVAGGRQEPIVLRHRLGGRVDPIREEGEVEVTGRVGEEVDLEPSDLLLDLGFARQQRRYHHEGPQARGNAVARLQTRQRHRPEHRHDRAVDERDREVGGRDDREEGQQGQPGERHAGGVRDQQGKRQEHAGHRRDGGQVAGGRAGEKGAQQPASGRDVVADLLLEDAAAVRDQVVARILGVAPGWRAGSLRGRGGPPGRGHREAGDLELGAGGGAGEILDRVTVLVAGREVQGAEGGAGAQRLVDEADALEEVGPVEGRHHAHAGDHVADRHVHRGLVLMLGVHQLVGRLSSRGELLVEPPQGGGRLGILLAQALHQLDGEGGGQGRGLEPLERERSTGSAAQSEEVVREGVGGLAGGASGHDALG